MAALYSQSMLWEEDSIKSMCDHLCQKKGLMVAVENSWEPVAPRSSEIDLISVFPGGEACDHSDLDCSKEGRRPPLARWIVQHSTSIYATLLHTIVACEFSPIPLRRRDVQQLISFPCHFTGRKTCDHHRLNALKRPPMLTREIVRAQLFSIRPVNVRPFRFDRLLCVNQHLADCKRDRALSSVPRQRRTRASTGSAHAV